MITLQRQANWILWSFATETALIVTPEEAECLIPLVRDARASSTHVVTYAAPVTRKMLHFNDLDYYAMPDLPTGWQAPTWLRIELGIFAGRLYFEYSEYNDLRQYLGFAEGSAKLAETIDDTMTLVELYETEDAVDNAAAEGEVDARTPQAPSFTARPLSFLQEWLAVRRKGQDFSHTPMGHVCQGKPLTTSHPFFTRRENGVLKPDGAATKIDEGKDVNGGLSSIDEVSAFDEEGYDDDDDFYDGEDDNGTFEEGENGLEDGTAFYDEIEGS